MKFKPGPKANVGARSWPLKRAVQKVTIINNKFLFTPNSVHPIGEGCRLLPRLPRIISPIGVWEYLTQVKISKGTNSQSPII